MSSTPPAAIALSATGYKVKGVQNVDLTWSGATTGLDVWRNGVRILINTPNDGAQTDKIGSKGAGSYTYRLCPTGSSSSCSNDATVNF